MGVTGEGGMDPPSARCPNCAAQYEVTDKFCGSCGARLPSPAIARESAPSSAPPASSQRRPATTEAQESNRYGSFSQEASAPVATDGPSQAPGGAYWGAENVVFASERARAYAGFWRRFWAIVIDTVIVLLLAIIGGLSLLAVDPDLPFRAAEIVGWVIVVAYFTIGNGRGATLGKKSLGIKVVDAAGNPPGLQVGFIRGLLPQGAGGLRYILPASLGWITGVVFVVQLIDLLWMLWDDRRQTLHDKMAGTYVVNA